MDRVSIRAGVISLILRNAAAGLCVLATLIPFLSHASGAEIKAAPGHGAVRAPPPLDFSILDTAGVVHSLRTNPERAALVLVFLATECPIANGYVPELNRQFAALQEARAGVEFYGVISDRSVTRAAAAVHAA